MELVDLALDLDYNEEDGSLIILTSDDEGNEKAYVYDGYKVYTDKEVSKPVEDKEKTFSEEDIQKMIQEKDKALDDKEKIISWLDAGVKHLAPLAKAGQSYLEDLKEDCIKQFVLLNKDPESDDEVDLEFVNELIKTCGDNAELLKKLRDDYKDKAEDKFPTERRSSEEENVDKIESGEKPTAPVTANPEVDRMHNVEQKEE
jgi:hypothetical protein